MALNKKGETTILQVLVISAVILLALYITDIGGMKGKLDSIFGKSSTSGTQTTGSANDNAPIVDTAQCPTSGTTTYTINVQDALASSATSVYPDYYFFNGNKLIKEGSLTPSANTVDVTCGKDYDVLLVNTTTTYGFYGKVINLKARIAQDTVNEKLTMIGGAKINYLKNIDDPAALANITLYASATKNFDIGFSENVTEKGFNKPILMCQTNISSISTLKLTSFTDNTGSVAPVDTVLPKRITAAAGTQYWGWEYPKMLDQITGTVVAHMTVTATSVAPAVGDGIPCMLVDQTYYKTPAYKTSKSIDEGFIIAPENIETRADIGARDTVNSSILFDNRGL